MTSIQFLKGVGPKKAELFGRLGIGSLDDLLFYFPRAWEDRRLAAKKDPLPFLDPAPVIKGKIKAIRDLYTSSRLRIFKAVLETPSGEAEASFFKRHSPRFDVFALLRKDLKPGRTVWITGTPEDPLFLSRLRADEYYADDDERALKVHIGRIVPVYPLTEGLTAKFMREAVYEAVMAGAEAVGDFLPKELAGETRPGRAGPGRRGHTFPGE